MQRQADPAHDDAARRRYDRAALLDAGPSARRMVDVVDRAASLSDSSCRALAEAFRRVSDSPKGDLDENWSEVFRYTWPYPQHPPDLYAIDPLSRAAMSYAGLVARERAGAVLGPTDPAVGLVERAAVGAVLALAVERAAVGGWYMPVPGGLVPFLSGPWSEVVGPPEDAPQPDPGSSADPASTDDPGSPDDRAGTDDPAPGSAASAGTGPPMSSHMCRQADLASPAFRQWAEAIRPGWDRERTAPDVIMHRKLWEWLFIIQALDERGMLAPGRRGLGFGVGTEPLVSYFAGRGCEIVATDLDPLEAEAVGWDQTNQYAGGIDGLNPYGLCEPGEFRRRTSFRVVNMNAVPRDLRGFDFNWSSCAFEHLGSIERGVQFIVRQMDTLRPGGVAVHTTEFNVGSERETVEEGGTVLFRRRDIEEMAGRLTEAGHHVECDFSAGDGVADRHVDAEPYSPTHLKVALAGYVTTSFGLIIEKGGRGRTAAARARSLLRRISPPSG